MLIKFYLHFFEFYNYNFFSFYPNVLSHDRNVPKYCTIVLYYIITKHHLRDVAPDITILFPINLDDELK